MFIKSGRKKPGLAPQHLTGVQLVHRLSGGDLDGAAVGSTSITFRPQERLTTGRTFVADTQTAGSCTLLAQIAVPCCLFALPPAVDAKDNDDAPDNSGSR